MKITYTLTDESPALATYSFLPIVRAFLKRADVDIDTADISLGARILASFTDASDDLGYLGELVLKPEANLIKTPNISASIPQLKSAIKELQAKGYNVPNYPDEPKNSDEENIKSKYQKILGSAVNPVLRAGNSDRRCTKAVKEYAKKNPYRVVEFNKDSKSRVSYMKSGDFFDNEKAILIKNNYGARIEFEGSNGIKILKDNWKLEKGEILDATFMSVDSLSKFYEESIDICKKENILLSLHLKATMMKVSDPIIFGYAIRVYFKELFLKYQDEFDRLGVNPNNGVKELLEKIEQSSKKDEILAMYNDILNDGAPLSMVNSDKGITNLHVPSDVIVDASMPAMLRNGARLWDKDGKECDSNALIPDKTYATIYEAVLDDLRINGTLDPSKIGSVSNVGLMAKKAQEYGSHDKTFVAPEDGKFRIVSECGEVLLEHSVKKGDIYRANEAKIDAINNWIDLAIERAHVSGCKIIFWLDPNRPSNKLMIDIVHDKLEKSGIFINDMLKILPPKEACIETLSEIREGKDCISVTGNVLRDYLTDLFPILELGTSAKMLSVVPMLNGGAMFETGAGGSAPKQVDQLIQENHLRWDSLGEFLALQASLEFLSRKTSNKKAEIMAKCLDEAIGKYLDNNKAPSRKAKEDDNRTSHFYLAMYLAESLSLQNEDASLSEFFKNIFEKLVESENKIYNEYIQAQGCSVDLGGYYKFDDAKCEKIMRSSDTFNSVLSEF